METKLTFFRRTGILDLLVGEDGSIYSWERRGFLNQMRSRTKTNCYLQVAYKGQTYSVHVLVAKAFVPFDIGEETLVVNHKDGNGTNNHYRNLEWATYSQNSIHAYKTGLRTDNNLTWVKDLRTGGVQAYYSQAEAARQIGCSAALLTLTLKSGVKDRLLGGRYIVSRSNEDWPDISANPDVLGIGCGNFVAVHSKAGLKIFRNLRQASDHTGEKYHTLVRAHRNNRDDTLSFFSRNGFDFIRPSKLSDYIRSIGLPVGDNGACISLIDGESLKPYPPTQYGDMLAA